MLEREIEGCSPIRVASDRQPPARSQAHLRTAIVGFVQGFQAAYQSTMKIAQSCGRDPEAFCDEVLEALSRQVRITDDDISAFLAWATEKHQELQFLHVLRARHAFLNRAWDVAVSSARRAGVLDPEDTLAQALLLAARRRAVSLRSDDDEWLEGRFCPRPFETFETRTNEKVYTCCSAWMTAHIGEFEQAPTDIWNSEAAQEIRRSVLDGDFRYCSRMYCPLISDRRLPKKDEVTNPKHRRIIRNHSTRLNDGPTRVLLSHDRSCNLSCPSCRTSVIAANKSQQADLNEFADRTLLPLMKNARLVKVTGSGDPFGSNHFRYVLSRISRSEFPGLKLEIQTNGVLFDRRAWNDLDLDGLVDSVWVSLDAARRETYEIVRRGGDFDRLVNNLRFLGEMRSAGKFRFFRLDFVVQWRNYREMPGVVEVARDCRADTVSFQRIRNWGTFSVDAFALHDVCSREHPEHEQFLDVLRDPILGAADIDWGNIRPFFDDATEPASCLRRLPQLTV